MNTITIDKSLLVRTEKELFLARNYGGTLRDDPLLKDVSAVLALASAPAWHDAPTCAGLWITTDGQSRPAHWLVCRVTDAEHEASQSAKDERWYGPIPEDKL